MKRNTLKDVRGDTHQQDKQKPGSNLKQTAGLHCSASGFCSHPHTSALNQQHQEQAVALSNTSWSSSCFSSRCLKSKHFPTGFSEQNESLELKVKPKNGLFQTIRKRFTSPKHKCDSVLQSSQQISDLISNTKGHRIRSKSVERPSKNSKYDLRNTPSGARSVQLHKRHISVCGSKCRTISSPSARSPSVTEFSDSDDPIDERSKNPLPFSHDGYGHATPLSDDEISLFQESSSRCHSTCSSQNENDLQVNEPTIKRVPVLMPVYDQVKDPLKETWSLTKELFKLSRQGWYWGPINRMEAENKLTHQPDGAFLVRDSSDEHYLLSLSFRSFGRTLHTRIEHCNGVFSFYAQPDSKGFCSIVELIEHSMSDSQTGVFCYSRARTPGSPSFPVRLTRPVSRFTHVRTLQYLCRFVIRQTTRVDLIQKLPLPSSIRGWLQQNQY